MSDVSHKSWPLLYVSLQLQLERYSKLLFRSNLQKTMNSIMAPIGPPHHQLSQPFIQSCRQTASQGALAATHSIMDGRIAVSSRLPLLAMLIIFQSSFCQHDLLANHHVGHSPPPAGRLLSYRLSSAFTRTHRSRLEAGSAAGDCSR